MKKIWSMIGGVSVIILLLFLSGCIQDSDKIAEQEVNEELLEKIPVIDAYYKGEKIWFIHTDVSSPEMAERLTKMVNYRTLYVPRNAEAVDINKISRIYVFTNGVDHRDVKPWGGGPFGYQIDIFDSVPGDENYTSLRNPHLVAWNENSTPRVLTSEEELLQAEASGELTIKKTDIVVNVPVVRWPEGSAGSGKDEEAK